MARKRTAVQKAEIQKLHQWCMLFVELLLANGGDEAMAAELVEVIDTAGSEKDLTGLREVATEFKQWLRHFPADVQADFKQRVLLLSGAGLDEERRGELASIEEMLGRGVLRTADEYRLVLDRVEEIYADPASTDEVERLNRLLNTLQGVSDD